MARRSSSSSSTNRQRDTVAIASRGLLSVATPRVTPALTQALQILAETERRLAAQYVEDRRQWHPLKHEQPARKVSGRPAGLRLTDIRNSFFSAQSKARLSFADPRRVLTCIRRKTRKEVIHALKKAGRKGGSGGKRRRDWRSGIKC